MLRRLLDTRRCICLAANQTTQDYIEELRGVPNHLLLRSHSVTQPERAPTLTHMSLCACVRRSGALLLTVAKPCRCNPLSRSFARASSALMLAQVGVWLMFLNLWTDQSESVKRTDRRPEVYFLLS